MKRTGSIDRHRFCLLLMVAGLLTGLVQTGVSKQYVVTGLAAPLDSEPIWNPINEGLTSQDVRLLVIDPKNPDTIYAGNRGVFKSTDGGANWRAVGLNNLPIVALAISPSAPNVLYAGITFENGCWHYYRRLFKSIDGGASWTDAFSPPINGCDHIDALVLDPVKPDTLYVADYDHFVGDTWAPFMKSTDGGSSWVAQNAASLTASLAIDPLQPSTLYAGTFAFDYLGSQGQGVFKSTDGGTHWSATGLTNMGVNLLAIDPRRSNTLYAATSSFAGSPSRPSGFRGLFKSTDGGMSWFAVNNGLAHLIGTVASVSALVIDRDNPKVLYAGTGSGVFRSVDGGASWNPFNYGLTKLDVRTLALTPGNPNALYAGTSGGVFKIIDPVPTDPNSIDDAQSFVRQQYRDFLNREPDAPGWDFWTTNITRCSDAERRPAAQTEAECIDKQQVNTSAAFFLSPEFQYTGYYVYRLYKGSLIKNGSGRVPTYQEFLRDVRQVASGIIQNNQLSAAATEANKKKFAEEFIQRAEFRSLYDPLSNFDYVERLFQTTGISVSVNEKQALVDGLNNQTETRASVLQKIVDGAVVVAEGNQQFTTAYGRAFYQKEFNAAFVQMEYFGYLQRDPDAAGYQHWLDKLNFYGNYIEAEMVKSFIASPEYRARFAQP